MTMTCDGTMTVLHHITWHKRNISYCM